MSVTNVNKKLYPIGMGVTMLFSPQYGNEAKLDCGKRATIVEYDEGLIGIHVHCYNPMRGSKKRPVTWFLNPSEFIVIPIKQLEFNFMGD